MLSLAVEGLRAGGIVTQILKTMTIQEAAAAWSDPARIYLNKMDRGL
jgi:hypothetical protein